MNAMKVEEKYPLAKNALGHIKRETKHLSKNKLSTCKKCRQRPWINNKTRFCFECSAKLAFAGRR